MGKREATEASKLREAGWRDQQQRFAQSGQSVIAFCAVERMPVSTFYQRRARLQCDLRLHAAAEAPPVACNAPAAAHKFAASPPRHAGFVEVGAVRTPPPGSSIAAPFPHTGRAEISIDLGGGVMVRVVRS